MLPQRGLLLHAMTIGIDQVVAGFDQCEQAQQLFKPVVDLLGSHCYTGRRRNGAAHGQTAWNTGWGIRK